MKKITLFIVATCISMWLVSCAVTEETTFNPDGSVRFSYLIDIRELRTDFPGDSTYSAPAVDSTVSFAYLLDKQKDSIAMLPIERQEMMEALRPLKIRMVQNKETNEFFMFIYGDFKDVTTLNTGLGSLLGYMVTKKQLKKNPTIPTYLYSWNGQKMIKTVTRAKSATKKKRKAKAKADSITQQDSSFPGITYKEKYNFPKKVKSVSNPNALISEDGKSVTLEYLSQESIEQLSISIELED